MVTRRRILETVSGGALYALLGACAAPWSPQGIVAGHAATLLTATGREVSGPVEKPMPGVSVDDYRLSLGPFYKARGEWWNNTRSTVDYGSPDVANVDALVEIGMAYSAFFFGELIVYLDIKVVDPSTRKVITRARDYAHKPIGTPEAALKDEAAPFKQVFDEMATSLVRPMLPRVGLVPL